MTTTRPTERQTRTVAGRPLTGTGLCIVSNESGTQEPGLTFRYLHSPNLTSDIDLIDVWSWGNQVQVVEAISDILALTTRDWVHGRPQMLSVADALDAAHALTHRAKRRFGLRMRTV